MADATLAGPEARPSLLDRANAVFTSPWTAGVLVVGLVWALLQIAPWSEWRAALAGASPWMLALAVVAVLPSGWLKAWRMEHLVESLRGHRWAHNRIVFAMGCVGQLPVGTVGGDVFRVVRLGELGVEADRATAATFIIRLVGFSVTVALAAVGGAIYLSAFWPLLGLMVSGAALYLLTHSSRPPGWLRRLSEGAEGAGWLAKLRRALGRLIVKTFREARDMRRREFALMLAATLGIYAVRALVLWLCLLAVGVEAGFLAAVAALSVGNLASSVPSPAGSVGLREGGIVGVLASLGAGVAPATIGALLFRATVALGAALGFALCWLATRREGVAARS